MSAIAENERAALERLLAIAASDTGTSRRVADFLLSWWNKSSCGGFDMVDLWYFSDDIVADVVTVFRFVARNRHYPDDLGYGDKFQQIIRAWRGHLLEDKPATTAPAPAQNDVAGDLLREALEYRADHFDNDGGEETYVSGADMLDWFHEWRRNVRARLPGLEGK